MPLFGKKQEPQAQGGSPVLPPGDRFLPGGAPRGFRATKAESRTLPDGRRITRSGAGVSLVSQAEAEAIATDRARANLEAAASGRRSDQEAYAYSIDRGLEPVIETLRGANGEELARITMNSYAAVVMNATSMLFADIDGARDDRRLEEAVRDRPDLAFRIYRTPAGSRYLCTSHTFDPATPETGALLEDLGSDPKYVLLCRIQKCFRARITPKPWRTGQKADRIIASPKDGVSRGELERFLGKMGRYAAARYERAVGDALPLPELSPLIDYHDRWCQATSDRPLA